MSDSATYNRGSEESPIRGVGGPNWCFLCDNPSDSEVAYLNFAAYGGFYHAEFVCREHLWGLLEEQEEDGLDFSMLHIPFDPEWVFGDE